MKKFIWLLIISSSASGQVRCVTKNKERVIKHDTLQSGGCIVTINDRITYRAKNEKKFCQRKLNSHIKKLQQAGWYCVG